MSNKPTTRSEILDAADEAALITRAQRGDKRASDRLLLAYRPLAIRFAQEAVRQGGGDIEDLVQEAMLALAETLPRFEVSRGHRFGTFARWTILHRLSQYRMYNNGPVRVGLNIADKRVFQQYRRRRAAWLSANPHKDWGDEGRAAIAAEMNVLVEVIERMEPRILGGDVSLYQPAAGLRDEGAATVLDQLSDEPDEGPLAHTVLEAEETAETLAWVLRVVLDSREREIVERSMAVGSCADKKPEHLRDIGAGIGISGERVRQIRERAVEKMRRAIETAPGRAQRQADLALADVVHAVLTSPPAKPRRPRHESRARRARRKEARRYVSAQTMRLPLVWTEAEAGAAA